MSSRGRSLQSSKLSRSRLTADERLMQQSDRHRKGCLQAHSTLLQTVCLAHVENFYHVRQGLGDRFSCHFSLPLAL